jgi:DNA-3-methyladenine glycosylase I
MGAGGFARHLWGFVDGRPLQPARKSLAEVPAETEQSRAMARDLRARGGNFVGPTIVYAFMQATGMVNDHLVDCCRHEPCRALARDFGP